MKGIELKTVIPVVFDDPVYCNTEPYTDGSQECTMIDENGYNCRLFGEHLPIALDESARTEKCQQCKDHYKQNKSKTIIGFDEWWDLQGFKWTEWSNGEQISSKPVPKGLGRHIWDEAQRNNK